MSCMGGRGAFSRLTTGTSNGSDDDTFRVEEVPAQHNAAFN